MSDNQKCFRCGQSYKAEEMTTALRSGNAFCPPCWTAVDPKSQSLRKCPVDGADMTKRLVANAVVIDVCPQCGGLWFDKGELEVIEKKSRDLGWSEGFFLGMLR